ncbi:AtzG-like protein [Caulobacter sp. Root655]|uniref:AtzG-like protein n=1 Tax=Caulobacter sp. Root655 TaxID=1736578 RepID=UPI0009EBF1DE|nr:AtzG-like protein [Caulobacter sp. Root655]
MAVDPALSAFLALPDDAVAAYADARAEGLGLPLPQACRPGVIDNLTLLRRQAETFVAALPASAADEIEAFAP